MECPTCEQLVNTARERGAQEPNLGLVEWEIAACHRQGAPEEDQRPRGSCLLGGEGTTWAEEQGARPCFSVARGQGRSTLQQGCAEKMHFIYFV